ncbi:MAG: hypothetical protein ACK56I_25700, partial [bacterium]
MGVQPAHEVDAEVHLDSHLERMLLSADLDLSQLGGNPAVGRLDGEGCPELHVSRHSGSALESAVRRRNCLEHDTLGDLHQPLLLDLHDLSVKIPLDGVD